MYHRNTPKGIRVTERTGNLFKNITKGNNSKSKKAIVVNLVWTRYLSYRADKKFYADADANGIRPKNNMFPTPLFGVCVGWGDGVGVGVGMWMRRIV